MYKIVLHRLIWFPYRPGLALVGLLLLGLLFVVGATGAIKAIDIYVPVASVTAGSEFSIAAVVLGLGVALCISAARSDYVSAVAAAIPCLSTVLVVAGLTMIGTSPKAPFKSALVQSSASALAALMLISRLIQSSGPDLAEIGVYWRLAKSRLRGLQGASVDSPDFKTKRAELVEVVGLLAEKLEAAGPQLIDPKLCNDIAKKLESFLAYARMAEHTDFLEALAGGPQPLIEPLQMMNQGLR